MFFVSTEELASAEAADHEVGECLAPGVHIERRTIFRLGLAALAATALRGLAEAPPVEGVSYETFLKEVRPLADALIRADVPQEPAYLKQVEAMLRRISAVPAVEFHGDRPYKMTSMLREPPLVIYQIRMEPGARIKLHDHREYNGVLLGLDGQADCRNFDFVTPDAVHEEGDFIIRETGRALLKAGSTSSLSRTENNIHEVTAGPEGARLFDVFTFFSPKARSVWLDFNDAPIEPNGKQYKVRWR